MNIIKELEKIQKPVWEKVRAYLPENKEPKDFYQMISDYPERKGKYFRAGLLVWSALMHGAKSSEAYLPAAIMQLSEDWLLIHDDFEDHSLERRSTAAEFRPTLNVMHGDELAVNAGDALHLIMWKVLGDYTRFHKGSNGWKIYNKMNETLLKTTEGQHLELSWIRQKRIDVSEQEYFEMIRRKSALYTIICPIQIGAILAGADIKRMAQIEKWGFPFGCAFQIWDDYMNLTQASHIQGKEFAGDIMEGKRTISFIHLVSRAQDEEREKIMEIYSKTRAQKTEEEKLYILGLMQKYGSLEYAAMTARNYSQLALKFFKDYSKKFPNSKSKELIARSISYVADRKR